MNYIDIIFAVLIIAAAIHGFVKGLVFEAASLAALILGVWGGVHFSSFTADLITRTFNWQSEYLGLIAFLITFLIIVVIVHFLGNALDKLVEAVSLGFLNKTAGLFFGIIKAVFILSVLLSIYDRFDPESKIIPKEHKERSQVYEPLKNFAPSIFPFLNFSDRDNTDNSTKDLLKQTKL